MAFSKQYVKIESTHSEPQKTVVYPSQEATIEVMPNDGYNGAHKYRAAMCKGFQDGKTVYDSSKLDVVQFVQKNEDGTMVPGWQSEQLAMILLDRVKKLNAKFPCPQNEKQIQGLEMYLDACIERVEDRLSRSVMGDLKV